MVFPLPNSGRDPATHSVSPNRPPNSKRDRRLEVVDHRPIGFEVEVGLATASLVAGDSGLSGNVKAFTTIGGVPIKGILTIKAVMTTDGPAHQQLDNCEKQLYFVSTILRFSLFSFKVVVGLSILSCLEN